MNHVFLELGDHLGSSSTVLDKVTSELVERSTYEAYGGEESDYRAGRWKEFREDYRFTAKEDDVEVGAVYFGARYYTPFLNRWISADPLAVHAPGNADLNIYAYVHGKALVAVDPVGLAEPENTNQTPAPAPGAQPNVPLPPRQQQAFETGQTYGRAVGDSLASAEYALNYLHEKVSRQSRWDRMPDAMKAAFLDLLNKDLESIPVPPGFDDPLLEKAASSGFESGLAGGLADARGRFLALAVGVQVMLAATPAAAESVVSGGEKLVQTIGRVAESFPMLAPVGIEGFVAIPRIGRAPKWDWKHIIERHHPSGRIAQQRLAAGGDLAEGVFENVSVDEMKVIIKNAWAGRKRVGMQTTVEGDEIVNVRGFDPASKQWVGFYQHKDGTVRAFREIGR
jgi:RHS repeat-associated protein